MRWRRTVGRAVVRRGHGGVVVLAVLVAAVTLVGGGTGGEVPTARAAAATPPEPVLVVPGDATDGQVRVRPAAQAPDDGRLTWTVANGGEVPVALTLAVHEVRAQDGEVEVGRVHDRLAVPSRAVDLDAGEVARVRVPVPPDLAPGTVALVAAGVDADVEVVGLALVGPAAGRDGATAGVEPRVQPGPEAGAITVRLASDVPALVDVAVRASAWPGLVHDEQVLADVLVPVGGRDVPVAVSGPVVGRVTVDVAVSGQQAGRTSAALWWWPRELLVAVAVALVMVAGVAVALVARRGRRPGG